MNETEINWTELTWNPASGCTKVSQECKHCYAELIAESKRGTPAFPRGFDVMERPWKLGEPGKVKRASLIFTNSMTDCFHEMISEEYRDRIFEVVRGLGRHRFQILTKRIDIAADYFARRGGVPDNVWLGVTVGHEASLSRVAVLRSIPARVRFLSCEPLLTALDFEAVGGLGGVHWVIGGGESGVHASDPRELARRFLVRVGGAADGGRRWVPRADRVPWAQALRDSAKAAGAAFWWKQWGGPRPKSGGRELDGREWSELPDWIPGAMPVEYVHREGRAARAEGEQVRLPIVQ